MTVRIITADVMDGLRQLADESVHCVCTSPPYWGLRDYGVAGQIGLEPTPDAFVSRMVEVFREVRRMLRKDGTCWVNLGDSYAAGGMGAGSGKQLTNRGTGTGGHMDKARKAPAGFKPKDLIGIPWRVAFALQADGWWLRSDIIWAKPNPMPESVTDRPTKAHEYVFLLTKAATYYYDAEAIREAAEYGYRQQPANTWDRCKVNGQRVPGATKGANPEAGRNKRSVWTIATAPYADAHFATFPPELPSICIKAGTSEKGCCAKCGAPWGRETSVSYDETGRRPAPNKGRLGAFQERAANMTRDGFVPNRDKRTETLGWSPSCSCNADIVPATVLDCFAGAGTTCLVADRLQRNAIGIELNPEYAAMAEERIASDRGGLLDWIEPPAPEPPRQLSLLEAAE